MPGEEIIVGCIFGTVNFKLRLKLFDKESLHYSVISHL